MMTADKVTLYTQPNCPPCQWVKGYLSDHDVEYTIKDVSEDEAARNELIHQYKSMSTPTVVIGNEVITGFEIAKLEKLLNL